MPAIFVDLLRVVPVFPVLTVQVALLELAPVMICLYSWLVVLQALALSMSEPGYNVVKGSEKRRVITRGQSLSINDCKTSCMLMVC